MFTGRQLCLIVVLLWAFAVQASEYRAGTIIQVRQLRSIDEGAGAANGTATLNSGDAYEIVVRLGDIVYTTIYQPKWKWSFKPDDLVPGATLSMRLDGDKLVLKRSGGKEVKTVIVNTERPESVRKD